MFGTSKVKFSADVEIPGMMRKCRKNSPFTLLKEISKLKRIESRNDFRVPSNTNTEILSVLSLGMISQSLQIQIQIQKYAL